MSNESTTRRARRRAIVWPARWGIAVLLAGGLMLIDACSSSSSTGRRAKRRAKLVAHAREGQLQER